MSKYINRTNELLDKVKSILDTFVRNEDTSFWASEYIAEKEVTSQYIELLTDVKLLLFSDSPQHPLYIKTLELREYEQGSYYDFINLRDILSKYLEYRTFLEAED